MKRKKIIVVVPDGTGIRNYLFSQIIPNLRKKGHDILVYHALSKEAIKEVETHHNIKLSNSQMATYHETLIQKFFRETICYARLLHNTKLEKNTTILTNWKRNHKGFKKIFYSIVELVGSFIFKNYNRILSFEEKYQKHLESSIVPEIEFLKEHNPDVIFCTHQRALNAVPVFKAASTLGIKTVTAIYSWDNLVKARLAVNSDVYIVWSEYMKQEMSRYYPEIASKSIKITGTPQFCLYKTAEITSKEIFFEKHNLNPNKFTICFSGDDELTSPYDPKYLMDLADDLKQNNLQERVQIIFRRSPVDVSGRYEPIIEKYKDLITPIAPKWSNLQEHWTQLFPYVEDVNLLANICKHSDLVINVGSTMAHDFTFFDNPAAFINYDIVEDEHWSVNIIYGYQHFKSMPTKDAVYWINSKQDYSEIIQKLIKNKVVLGADWFKRINSDAFNSEALISKLLTD